MPAGSFHPHAVPLTDNLLLDWDEPDLDIRAARRKVPYWWCCRAGTGGAPGCGHRWRQAIVRRLNYGHGCLKCLHASMTFPVTNLMRLEWAGVGSIDQADRHAPQPWTCTACKATWQAPIALRVRGFGRCKECRHRRTGMRRRHLPIPAHVRADWDEDFPIDHALRKPSYRFVHRGSARGEVPCGLSWMARLWTRIKSERPHGCPHCFGPRGRSGKPAG